MRADIAFAVREQGFDFPSGGEPSSVGRNLLGAARAEDTPGKAIGPSDGQQQPDLRRGLTDLKAASADGAAKCVAAYHAVMSPWAAAHCQRLPGAHLPCGAVLSLQSVAGMEATMFIVVHVGAAFERR